jgi:hypothetical protein
VDSVSVDLSNLDASQQPSAGANISVAKSVGSVHKRMGSDVGDNSRSGCELNGIKQEGIRMGRETDAILCYLGTTQDQLPAFVIDSTQRYYSVTVPAMKGEAGEGNLAFLLRIQKTGDTLRMDMCEGSTPVLSEELTVTQSGTSVLAGGYHYFKGESGGPGNGFEDKGRFDLVAIFKDSAAGAWDYTDLLYGLLTASFHGNYGRGQMTFTKVSSVDVNDISGVFLGQFGPSNDNFTAQIAGRTDATKGTAKHAVSGTFPVIPVASLPAAMRSLAPNGVCPLSTGFDSCDPAVNFKSGGSCQGQNITLSCFCLEAATSNKCTFTDEGVESFSISTDATTGRQTFTKTASNDYWSYVGLMDLPAVADIITPAPSRNWDCSATGQTLVAIDATAVSYTACDANMKKGLDSSEHNSCQEQETTDKNDEGKEQGNLQ